MRFNLVYGNHTNPSTIEDVLRYVRLGLVQLGHSVEYNRDIAHNACNILLEAFTDDDADVVVNAANAGVEFITIATEFVTGLTFNNFAAHQRDTTWHPFDASTASYDNDGYWKARFDTFLRVAEVSRAIWCLAGDCQLQGYRDLSNANKVHLVPLEYLETYPTVQHQTDDLKNIDFLFTGTLSHRRLEILSALRSTGANVVASAEKTPAFIRDHLIGRAKICLNLLQTNDWKYGSAIRFFYHLTNNSCILSERYPVPSSCLDQYIEMFDKDAFVQRCIDTLREGKYTESAREKCRFFRDTKPEVPGFRMLLDLTYSVNAERRSRATDRRRAVRR